MGQYQSMEATRPLNEEAAKLLAFAADHLEKVAPGAGADAYHGMVLSAALQGLLNAWSLFAPSDVAGAGSANALANQVAMLVLQQPNLESAQAAFFRTYLAKLEELLTNLPTSGTC